MPLKGDAGFKFNRGAGVVTHPLQFPLYDIRPGRTKRRYGAVSLDYSAHEVITVGSAVNEIVATVRFDSDPWDLLECLEAGADGYELEYYPSLADTLTKYPCQLIEPSGDVVEAIRDRTSRGRLGEVEVEIRLRRIDGGNFEALYP